MIDILAVTILAFVLNLIIMWIMDLFSRSTEIQTRRSAANLNKIEPDVVCPKQHALPRPVINDGFSTPSGEDLNNQSFLRLMAENNLIVLEKERFANELSLVQSQLTDSHSKLRQFRIESATTKSKLEKQKSLITDITEKNLRLANDDSGLRRKIEDRDRMITLIVLDKERLVNELSLLQSQLTDSSSKLLQYQNVHDELATTKSELENNKREMTDIAEKNLRLTNEDSRLRRKIEDRDRLIASSQAEMEELKIRLDDQQLDTVHDKLSIAKRELELRNRAVTRLEKKNLLMMRNDKRLRRKLESTNRLLESSRAESERLRTSLAEQQLDKVHEDLVMTKRELELRNRAVIRLEKKSFRLMRNDKRLRRKIKNTNGLLLSGQAEWERLRTSLTEQQLDTREFAVATRELESKNTTISELETENLRLAENDSRLRRKIEDRDRIIASSAIEKNLIVLDKECLTNELSLLQSQLTDSSSKLQMFQNVHDELETTKSELENNKREMTGENLHLTNENSGLRRKIEAKDRLIAYKRAKLEKLQNSLEEKQLHKVHDELASSQRVLALKNTAITKLQEQNRESRVELEELRTCLNEHQLDTQQLAVATRELESKTRTITELEAKNLSLAKNDGRLRRKMEDADRFVLSSKVTMEELQLSLNKQTERVEQLVNQIRSNNEEVAELTNENHQLERNDQRLRQIIEETKLLVVSSNVELENLRTSLAEQQLDKVHELATATSEIESKNKIISELQTENLRLTENDSHLRRKMEDSDLLLLFSKAEVEGLRVSFNNQTGTIEHLLDQVKSLDQEKEEAVRKLDELEAKQKEMKRTSDVGCGSDEAIHPLRMEKQIPVVSVSPTAPAKSPITVSQPLATNKLPNSPAARTAVENEAVQVSTKQPPVALPEYSISSSVETEVYVDRIVVTGIANKECGRVVGRGGSNANRIEAEYYVRLSFINGKLFITGGDEESRLAACSDVIDILSVTIECPKINLRRNIFSEDYLLRELAYNHDVHIYRPSREYKYVTIWGALDNCRRVYEILQNGTR